MSETPARGYQWADAEPGNTLALKHGAYSEQAIEHLAAAVHGELLRVAPWLDAPQFAPSVNRYLQATAREVLAHEALVGMQPGAKGFTRLLETATAAARLAWTMGHELGLTPAGHARLKILFAGSEHAEASLADLAAAGAQARSGGDGDA